MRMPFGIHIVMTLRHILSSVTAPRLRTSGAIVLLLCVAQLSASASTVLYYQLDGNAGTSASSISDSGTNNLTGSAAAYGGGGATAPVYSSNTVGPTIVDGIGGAVLNANNTTSLKFDNPGVTGGNYSTGAGGRVTLASSALLEPASFTIEAFIKVEDQIQFASLIGKERPSGSTWLLDTNPIGAVGSGEPESTRLRGRFDHQIVGQGSGSGGFNQSFNAGPDGTISASPGLGDGWHHVAMTFDTADKTVDLYMDYLWVGGGTLSELGVKDLVYEGGSFFIGGGGGGRGFDGWIDEVRYSDTVLTTDEFLRVTPEPGRAMLLLLGATAVLFRRRRQG